MFYNNPKYQEKYYNLIDKTHNFKNKLKILNIDFQKPWWDIIWQQKKFVYFAIFTQLISSIFDVVFPILIGFAITHLNIELFLLLVLIKILVNQVFNIMLKYYAVFQTQCIGSVEYNSHKYFLEVDPIFHTTKSSGQIISKIHRGSGSFADISDVLIFEMLSTTTSLIAITFTMFAFGWELGLSSLFFVIILGLFNVIAQIFRAKSFLQPKIKADDKFRASSIETLLQAPFVRAIFASNEQNTKIKSHMFQYMITAVNSWQAGNIVTNISRTIYFLSIASVGTIIMYQAKQGILSPVLALSIILAYTNSTQSVLYVGDMVKRLTAALVNINDLFDFIRKFGQQTFPVLEEDKEIAT
jgi:ABC-type transport system involved in Fe-S cluster assembly fused permease/ATPase subunit